MQNRFKVCKHCDEPFDLDSQEKRDIGGLINECPWCLEELGGDNSPPKYLGVSAGNGKMSDITILQFDNDADRSKYKKMWDSASGANKGKVCQISKSSVYTNGLKFNIVSENRANDNHKGKG